MYTVEFYFKDTTRSRTYMPLTYISSCIEKTVNITLPFTKNVTISVSISQILHFCVANIQPFPAFSVFISHLIRYARACFPCECFILRAARLSYKLIGQGYVRERLTSSLMKFSGRYGDLVKPYEVSLSQMLHNIHGEYNHTIKTVYGPVLASLTGTVASPYTKQKVKHSVRKSIPNKGMLL